MNGTRILARALLLSVVVAGGCTMDFPRSWWDRPCGNGVLDEGEACDDGNQSSADGCSNQCQVEDGWHCDGEPSACAADCGDGKAVGTEECDDGNLASGDGCDIHCKQEDGWVCANSADGPSVCESKCGDGFIRADEVCDDGNTDSGDGCSANCTLEDGWTCDDNEPTVCQPICGDGKKLGNEACDDGNTDDCDGCAGDCSHEDGVCGDGYRDCGEACDDGNTVSGDGCHEDCSAADCSNGSVTDCNAATNIASSAFVDPEPPPGFIECAGFQNTAGDDVDKNWEVNCLGHDWILRIRYWDTNTDPWTLLGDAILSPAITAAYNQETFDASNQGGTEGMLADQGVVLLEDDPAGTQVSNVSCDTDGDQKPNYGANDLYFANSTNTKNLFVCSAEDDLVDGNGQIVHLCGADQELLLFNASLGHCAQDPGTFTHLAIAIYYQLQ
ncbi:MAG: DUF4215 domain-containing protein [Deltaproteobacteria bacterium]|nr:DUF4215 domain-containing protein [Deltaproteobacteria bacterium]